MWQLFLKNAGRSDWWYITVKVFRRVFGWLILGLPLSVLLFLLVPSLIVFFPWPLSWLSLFFLCGESPGLFGWLIRSDNYVQLPPLGSKIGGGSVVPLHLLDYLQATLPRLGVTKAKVFAHYFSRLVFSGFSSDLVHCVSTAQDYIVLG